jgi:hypothetical protein
MTHGANELFFVADIFIKTVAKVKSYSAWSKPRRARR